MCPEAVMTETFHAADGLTLAYHELGTGRPVVLLHGYTSTGAGNWVTTGIAARLAASERRVIMPDLRGHGDSARPHDAAAYPPDALTSDALALIEHLGLSDYDLGGYSLGGRIVARMLALGARPGRAVVAGTGLEPIIHAAGRGENYRRVFTNLGTFVPGSFEAQMEEYLASTGADPVALVNVLDTFVDTPLAAFAQIEVPTLVIAGDADVGRGSVPDLAAAIPGSRLRIVPGDHWTALTSPELTDELVRFLCGGAGE
jgi:pimeloyl-ACP methyl ester carboxylesterase